MTPDPRLEWLRENVPGFKACHDQAEAARKSTEENRLRMAAYMTPENLKRWPVEPVS